MAGDRVANDCVERLDARAIDAYCWGHNHPAVVIENGAQLLALLDHLESVGRDAVAERDAALSRVAELEAVARKLAMSVTMADPSWRLARAVLAGEHDG